ncbi:HPr family phosphocarrier protein [Pseudarthrobacter sp. J75]|uniref:HPr family phosphocarrier protein n=1 Tax=unclassified Pseudarthrobacter TaxID=2647000 RepID=UPI002E811646|nr:MULTISPECIES: HPr family phosphocarrier protein [unclassified Pseudarthrobacter]MEE2523316.1 HPr family phosphocarrier protein [Pseudarthrobacter sp. J47]MEE2529281.1 HPr family phosphocarrier protein [Pseudarthrobacter sp. J75]
MPVRSGTVAANIGLHARPAALFVRAVTETGLPIVIRRSGSTAGVDARSLLEVMTADFDHGCKVDLVIDDQALEGDAALERAEAALERLVKLLESQNGA